MKGYHWPMIGVAGKLHLFLPSCACQLLLKPQGNIVVLCVAVCGLFIYFNLMASKVIHTYKNDINSRMDNP